MGTEIERKFRLDALPDCTKDAPKAHLLNIYVSTWKHLTIRVRLNLTSEIATLTIKGANKGISRFEEEFNIPYKLGSFFRNRRFPFLEKERFEVRVGGHLWEVDKFLKENDGLIVAEIELDYSEEKFEMPTWIDERNEVSYEVRYYNSNLVHGSVTKSVYRH